ncbi:MAG TPA: ABC transporter permease [Dehalococcoidia bacterium]|nr:ABC transporter permease [Dehalococcoidia bacterium]
MLEPTGVAGDEREAGLPGIRVYVNALRYAFLQQWRQMFVLSGIVSPMIGALGPAAVIGYIAGRSDSVTAISYVFVGASLSIMWNNGIFRTGWSLAEEQSAGTLDLMMTTRTPVALIMLGKALAIMAFAAVAGIVTFFVVLGISSQVPPVDNAALFLASGIVALIAVVVSSFFFAPFSFLAGVRGGFFNAIMPFGAVVSGFLYPIDLLPGSLEAVARLMPTAWAMQAVVDSLDGSASDLAVVIDLAVALALSAVLLTVSFLLFIKVERRVRLSGSLGTV